MQVEDLSAFLHKVAYYKVMDFPKNDSPLMNGSNRYIDRMSQLEAQRADELLIDNEMRTLLLKAINQLPPQRKLIYQLSREEKLTHKQIASGDTQPFSSTVNNALVASTRSIARFSQEIQFRQRHLIRLFLLG